jgi:hypothetical protein
MSKRVKIAVIREATLNAKPTDTHYLAEGGLQIPRKDARALKGMTLYYEVIVDLGELTGFNFVIGRDIPVYETDSEPVLALDPRSLQLIEVKETFVEQAGPITMHTHTVDTSLIPQNAAPVAPTPEEVQQIVENAQPAEVVPVKRKPGRPKKIVEAVAPVVADVTELINEPVDDAKISSEAVQGQDPEEFVEVLPEPDFQVTTEKQDDESTFLIDPEGIPPSPVPQAKPEFSFDVDEDEAPPPPPVRHTAPQNLGFEVEDEETPAPAPAAAPAEKPAPIVTASGTDDFGGVDTGMFDE